jgi:hypothetical protein
LLVCETTGGAVVNCNLETHLMRLLRRPRLALERLETRACPSLTLSLFSGTLNVTGVPNGTLALTETGTSTFKVTDGTATLATFAGVSNISVRLSHRPFDLNVQLNAAGLGGNLYMDLGTGWTVGPSGTVHVSGGRIGGSLTILRGNGNETYDLGINSAAAPDPLRVGGSVSINAITSGGVAFGSPRDSLFLEQGSSIGLDLNTTNVDSVLLAPTDGVLANSSVGRNVSISNTLEHTTTEAFLLGTVGQDATVNGPNTGIFVIVGNGPGTGTTGRNLSIGTLGGDSVVALSAGSLVGGTANITTGGGNDFIELTGQVNGNATVSSGDGNDTIQVDATAAVFGTLHLNGGNGANTLTVNGSVSGDLVFNQGNGDNSATITQAPGGVLRWTSGNGNDTLNLTPATAGQLWNVNIQFGSGDDTLNLNAPGGTLTGRADGGGRITANAFNQDPSWTLTPTFTLSNFP